MADVRSNHPEVVAAIRAIAASWDFRARGRYRTLGEDALDAVAEGIYTRTLYDQAGPDGSPLAPLKTSTLERKHRLGYPETVGVETHGMLSFREIQGERVVERRWARMTYGTRDDTRLKAEWFSEGNAKQNRAPRPFYELDEAGTDGDHVDALLEEVLERNLRDLGG